MQTTSNDPNRALTSRELRLDSLLSVAVVDEGGRPLARIEEFRAEPRGTGCVITHVVLGASGLAERMGLSVKLLFGIRGGGYVARWDQIDVSDPKKPRLTCPIEELERA